MTIEDETLENVIPIPRQSLLGNLSKIESVLAIRNKVKLNREKQAAQMKATFTIEYSVMEISQKIIQIGPVVENKVLSVREDVGKLSATGRQRFKKC